LVRHSSIKQFVLDVNSQYVYHKTIRNITLLRQATSSSKINDCQDNWTIVKVLRIYQLINHLLLIPLFLYGICLPSKRFLKAPFSWYELFPEEIVSACYEIEISEIYSCFRPVSTSSSCDFILYETFKSISLCFLLIYAILSVLSLDILLS
jgi:hypothetical protein